MNNIKVGDLLKCIGIEAERKVLGICGDMVAMSAYNNFGCYAMWFTKKELEQAFILPKEKWLPENLEKYWYLNNYGETCIKIFDDHDFNDAKRIEDNNYFKSEKDAEEVLVKVKELLAKLKE